MRPGDIFLATVNTTLKEYSTMNTISTPISSPEIQLDTGPVATARDTRLKASSKPTRPGARKTSFHLSELGRKALEELIPMWEFPSQGEAVTQALLYLLHQSKRDAVRRLPAVE